MMEDNSLSFWAQSLDNKAPDTIVKGGKKLDPSQAEAQNVCDSVDRVVSEKTKLFDESGVTIYCKDFEFVIEAIPKDLDSGKRRSPIVIYGQLPEDWLTDSVNCTDFSNRITEDMTKFAGTIGRAFNPDTLHEIKRGLKVAHGKKKYGRELRDLLLHVLVAVTIPIMLGWILQKQVPQTVQQQFPQPIPQQLPQISIMQIAGLIAMNNVLLLILPKLSITSILTHRSRTTTK